MADEWPLIGRTVELETVTGLLRSGDRGVVLAGPAGVGKTRLATACLGVAARQGFTPLRVAATAVGAALPFGAFATLLPDLTSGADRLNNLRLVGQAITERDDGKPVALLVDDAHLLDEASAALTHQLAVGGRAFVLVTLRSGQPAPDAVVALWKDNLAERLELEPLSPAEVEELLAAALDGQVDGATAREIWQRTEGNPLFLRELVRGALEAGTLQPDRGVWRLHGRLPASARLIEIVEVRLADVGLAERQSLDIVALGEPLGVDLLALVDEHVDIEALERRGLLRLQQDGRRLQCRLSHPLYSEVLRARLSPLRLRRAVQALAEITERVGSRRREDVLRVAAWRLQAGGDVDPGVMLAGAKQAYARHDLALAEELATAAWDAGSGFDAGLLRSLVLSQTGRAQEAEAAFAGLVPQAGQDQERAVLAVARIENLAALGRIGEVLAVAETAEQSILDPVAKAEVAVWRAFAFWLTGRVVDARAEVERLLPGAEGRALISACAMAGHLFATAGRVSEALETSARGLAAHRAWSGPPLRWTPHVHLQLRCQALVLGGRLGEAEALASSEYDQAVTQGDAVGQGWLSWSLAMTHLAEGRADNAVHWGRVAAGLCRDEGHVLQLGHVLICLAHGLALAGETEEAWSTMAEYEKLPGAGADRHPELLQAKAWISAVAGDVTAAGDLLGEAARSAGEQGSLAYEAAALHDLARLGRAAGVVGRLGELAEQVEGSLASARYAHATGLAADDAAALEAVADDFAAMPAWLLAAEAAAAAAAAWRAGGESRRASAVARRAGGLMDRCEGARTPALVGITAGPAPLSSRELEFARLAASGASNKEIAARLFVSLRTVENRLHGVYEKLGVEGRVELREALEGL